jgi:chorismate synthase
MRAAEPPLATPGGEWRHTNGNRLFSRRRKTDIQHRSAQRTINLHSGEQTSLVVEGRHDACFALRLPVVIEAATAIVLADLMLLEQWVERVGSRNSPA